MSSRTLGIANLQISSELLKEVFDFNGSTTKMLQPWRTPAFLLGVLTPQDKLLWSPWDLHKLCACKTLMDTVTIALVWCPKNLEGGNKSIKMWLIQMKSASGVKYSLVVVISPDQWLSPIKPSASSQCWHMRAAIHCHGHLFMSSLLFLKQPSEINEPQTAKCHKDLHKLIETLPFSLKQMI